MVEIILVNRVRYTQNAVGEVKSIEKVDQILIPISRIVEVEPLKGTIRKEVMTEEVMKQIKGMSLDEDLGGSLITYVNFLGNNEYVSALETPYAIYRKIYPE